MMRIETDGESLADPLNIGAIPVPLSIDNDNADPLPSDDMPNVANVECHHFLNSAHDSLEEMEIDDIGDENLQSPKGMSIEIVEGMEFESLEKVFEVYSEFAKDRGFGLRRRSSKPRYCVWVCSNEGKHKQKEVSRDVQPSETKIIRRRTSSERTGCQAGLHVLLHKWRNVWVVTKFNNEHNHKLVTLRSVSLMRNHRSLSDIARCLTEKFLDARVPTSKVVDVVNKGESFFDKRDCWNYAKRLRVQKLDVGDAQYVYNYCRMKKEEDSEFFYSIQCDDEASMVNFFWVDGRSRRYYALFGDVVTFDTTYKTNKYCMPFVPFTGINHHMRSMLYGCALLQDESEVTFIWLFETWLEAMNGKEPKAIITDQDHAIGNAINKVFPNTVHRLCLWHIMEKFPEKLASIYHKKSAFKKGIKNCIRNAYTIDEFEKEWMHLIEEYNLHENEWLKGLYEMRHMWVPIFSRDTFFGGMNTTQRSESMNSYFDKFVNSRTNLREFMHKFEQASESMFEKEEKEDYDSRHKNRILHLQSKLEEHAAEVYTTRVFGKIFNELEKVNKFKKEKIGKEGTITQYKVTFIDNPNDFAYVHFDSESVTVECSCKLWRFMGLLCRHAFAIFQKKDVHIIPDQYILSRWTKEANVGVRYVDIVQKIPNEDLLVVLNLQKKFGILLDVAKGCTDAYNHILTGLEQLCIETTQLYAKPTQGDIVIDLHRPEIGSDIEDIPTVSHLKDPNISQTKGRKKDSVVQSTRGRMKSSLEVALNKGRFCKVCGERGHNVRTCKQISSSQP